MSREFLFALILSLLSGATALSHELLWTRRLVDLVGATNEATSRVLGCFFLGLALGAVLAERFLRHVRNPWFALGYAELAIGVLAIPAALLPWWTDWIWPLFGPTGIVGWPGWLIKSALCGAVVIPPAVAMGATLPLLAAAALHGKSFLGRQGVWIYAVNTLGGAAGLWLSSGVMLQRFGVAGAMVVAILGNVIVAGIAIVFGMRQGQFAPDRLPSRQERRQRRRQASHQEVGPLPMAHALCWSLFSGIGVLALEVVAMRMLGLVMPSSLQATMAVLVSVILMLGIAAALAPLLHRCCAPATGLAAILSVTAIACAAAPLLLFSRSMQLIDVPHIAQQRGQPLMTTFDFQLLSSLLAVECIGPAVLASGLCLPAVFAWYGRPIGDSAGRQWGRLLAINGVGGLAGALLAEYALIPAAGIYSGMAVIGLLYALASLAACCTMKAARWQFVIPACGLLIAGWLAVGPIRKLPYLSPRTTQKYDVLATSFGGDGVLTVVQSDARGHGIIMNNQYMLGSTKATEDQRRQGIIPMLLHDAPAHVCCLGLATGHTAGAVLDDNACREVMAVEISRLVVDAAREHFADSNNGLFDDSRTRVVVEDARTFIAAAPQRFDVVIGDLYRPYGAGEGRLFSVEHFGNVQASLKEEGIFCQWLPMYQLTSSQFRIIAASFLEVFPQCMLVRVNFGADYPVLGLVGSRSNTLVAPRLSGRYRSRFSNATHQDQVLQFPETANRLLMGQLSPAAFKDVPLNTLDNARIEIDAGRRRVYTDLPQTSTKSAGPSPDAYLVGPAWKAFTATIPSLLLPPESIEQGNVVR